MQCFPTAEDEQRFLDPVPDGFPVGRAEERTWISRYAQFSRLCAASDADLLNHVTTKEVAKDMDLLRQAVGDPKLNYYGTSYGTFLGATYANLFPDKVRAMVLDGNVDPVAYTNNGAPNPS